MDELKSFLDEQMKNPLFRSEWEKLEPEEKIMYSIFELRRIRGITQQEFASRARMSQGDISKLESGVRNPSLNMLKRLARALDLDIEVQLINK